MCSYALAKGLYNTLFVFVIVPRFLLFPSLLRQQYLRTATWLLLCFLGNLSVLTFYLPGCYVPPFYEALFNPVMSFWFAIVLCMIEQEHPGRFKYLNRR